jgi:hypothetical protein
MDAFQNAPSQIAAGAYGHRGGSMKSALGIVTVAFVLAASAALAQWHGCSKRYGVCMDSCAKRPEASQGTCQQTCEQTSNQCYTGMYGQPPANGGDGGQATISEPARDAQGSAAQPSDK